jgi:hypothetical protein
MVFEEAPAGTSQREAPSAPPRRGHHESGDDDVTDNDLEGWNRLFPSLHGHFGDVDFMSSISFGRSPEFLPASEASVGYNIDCMRPPQVLREHLPVRQPRLDPDLQHREVQGEGFRQEVDACDRVLEASP